MPRLRASQAVEVRSNIASSHDLFYRTEQNNYTLRTEQNQWKSGIIFRFFNNPQQARAIRDTNMIGAMNYYSGTIYKQHKPFLDCLMVL